MSDSKQIAIKKLKSIMESHLNTLSLIVKTSFSVNKLIEWFRTIDDIGFKLDSWGNYDYAIIYIEKYVSGKELYLSLNLKLKEFFGRIIYDKTSFGKSGYKYEEEELTIPLPDVIADPLIELCKTYYNDTKNKHTKRKKKQGI